MLRNLMYAVVCQNRTERWVRRMLATSNNKKSEKQLRAQLKKGGKYHLLEGRPHHEILAALQVLTDEGKIKQSILTEVTESFAMFHIPYRVCHLLTIPDPILYAGRRF